MRINCVIASLSLAFAFLGCGKAKEEPAPKATPKPSATNTSVSVHRGSSEKEEHGHEGQDLAAAEKPAKAGDPSGHDGDVIELGTSDAGEHSVRASRDKGDIRPGGDAPIDVWIDDGVGKGVIAVRFWIGAADAKGSIKAKAQIEEGKWHTHVEVPDPLPPEAQVWVEIETEGGKKKAVWFDLKK